MIRPHAVRRVLTVLGIVGAGLAGLGGPTRAQAPPAPSTDAPAQVAAALAADPELSASQRRALLEMYAAFRDANVVRRRRSELIEDEAD